MDKQKAQEWAALRRALIVVFGAAAIGFVTGWHVYRLTH